MGLFDKIRGEFIDVIEWVDDGEDTVLATLMTMAAGNALFRWTGAGFAAVPQAGGSASSGWAWSSALADFDLDGRLDVFCVNGFVTGDLPQDT